MGVKDGFTAANVPTKIALFVVLLAVFVNWIAFCTTSWYVTPDIAPSHYGLWRTCSYSVTSGIVSDSCTVSDTRVNDNMDAVQAFAIFGFMGINLGFVLILLYMFWKGCKGNSETGIASAITLLVAAACWLIAVAIFGAFTDDQFSRYAGTKRLGYSFALAVCALGLSLIGGIIMIIGGRGNSSVGSK